MAARAVGASEREAGRSGLVAEQEDVHEEVNGRPHLMSHSRGRREACQSFSARSPGVRHKGYVDTTRELL